LTSLRPIGFAALAALALAGCGAAAGLIPPENASRLEHDFEEVARAASAGECNSASELLERTEADFQALPASVARSLRGRLHSGIAKLHEDALRQCSVNAQRSTSTTATTSHLTTTATTTSSAETIVQTTSSVSTSEAAIATTTGEPSNGGTPVPEENGEGRPPEAGTGEHGAPGAQPPGLAHGPARPGAGGPAR
jgi:hypothetical protein